MYKMLSSALSPIVLSMLALSGLGCGAPRADLPAEEVQEQTAAAATQSVRFNRRVERVQLSRDAAGQVIVKVQVGLHVFDRTTDTLNMTADLLINVRGRTTTIRLPDVVKHSAITCAVTCAGACPSIFGDGVCTGCGCKYNNWFTAAFGGTDAPQPGDVISARLVPSRGGLPEENTSDDLLRAVF